MSKCEFVYETEPGPFFDYASQQVTLRCKTHNCTIHMPIATEDGQICLIGRIERLEERVAQLERPTTVPGDLDELGNPFSLRIPTKPE
jgi:hypothetical protein